MPNRLGRYVVRRRIGAGSFATVWLAYDEQLDSPVAIKVLADNWTDDFDVRRRFIEEGRFLRKVDSPHVVSVYDAGELDDERPYLVMTYADQGTLADRLKDGPLDPALAVEVIRQVGLGLDALHKRQVLHRDVKPANILFRSGDDDFVRAMLGDLGLGKSLDMSSRLTMIAGTPSYVAPEQARGNPLDARADQYSLGALTYLVLTGRAPYQHASLAAAAEPGAPAPMEIGNPALEAVIARALAPERDERWATVREYVGALVGAANGTEISPPPRLELLDSELTQVGKRPSPVPTSASGGRVGPRNEGRIETAGWGTGRPRRWPLVTAAAVVALAGGGVAGYFVQRETVGDPEVVDAQGVLSVVVPDEWRTVVGDQGWIPPDQDISYPALRIGSAQGPGVFLGILPGDSLPSQLPGHPQCDQTGPSIHDRIARDDVITVTYSACPGVIVERVIHVATNRLLWVQVRSDDQATANAVLDSVQTHGL
jgi:eukaryotic-like serine/threonine-protein kinase